MDKASIMKRALRPVINWAVETFFPDGSFYGSRYADKFKDLDEGTVPGYICASFLVHKAATQNATLLTVNISEIEKDGQDIGSWRITVENTVPGSDFPRKLDIPEDEKIHKVSISRDLTTGEREVVITKPEQDTAGEGQ